MNKNLIAAILGIAALVFGYLYYSSNREVKKLTLEMEDLKTDIDSLGRLLTVNGEVGSKAATSAIIVYDKENAIVPGADVSVSTMTHGKPDVPPLITGKTDNEGSFIIPQGKLQSGVTYRAAAIMGKAKAGMQFTAQTTVTLNIK